MGSREVRVGVKGEGRGFLGIEVVIVLLGFVEFESVFENVLRF